MSEDQQWERFWREDPKMVRRARDIALANRAQRDLWRVLVESWAVPTVNWLADRQPRAR